MNKNCKKTYCKKYLYFKTETHFGIIGEIESCVSPKNKFDNYKEPNSESNHPSEINKNNDCKWFKAK